MKRRCSSMKSNKDDNNPDKWVFVIDDTDHVSPAEEKRIMADFEKQLEKDPELRRKIEKLDKMNPTQLKELSEHIRSIA